MDVSVVIPTVDGRAARLRETVAEYEAKTPGAQILVVRGRRSCGEAWIEGARRASRRFVHFTADDVTPAHGWWREPTRLLAEGVVPICTVENPYGREQPVEMELGALGDTLNVQVPFLARDMLTDGWMLPIHYGSDTWATYWAAKSGYELRACPSYRVVHHLSPHGRVRWRREEDISTMIRGMVAAGYLPPFWHESARRRGIDF